MLFLWLKAAHIFFVIAWFAGLFYLPRIFVNLAMVEPGASHERTRLLAMGTRLKRFMIPLMAGTWIFGLAMIFSAGGDGVGVWMKQGWLHAKLLIVLFLSAYDGYCKKLLRDFQQGRNRRSHTWYRVFNEVPAVALLLVVWLVVLKPF